MKSFAEWPLTRRARRLPVWIPALLLGVTLLTSIVSPATAVAGEPLDIPYPRFGMAIPSFGSSAASRAAYDFMVLQHDQLNMIAGLRTANPDIIVLGWTNAMELWFSTGSYDHVFNQELRSASSDWMFTEAGTTLRTAITTSVAPGSTLTETIALPAGAGSMFRADDAVLIGGTPGSGFTGDSPMRRTTEIARVVSVSGDTLTVARGEFWPTKTHAAGTRIAALTSAWSRHIEMDVRDACPAVDVGYGLERWQDFNARRGYDVMHAPDTLGQRFDGLHIDAFGIDPGWALFNNQFIATFDPNRTNTSYTDKATFYPAWNVGLGHYAEKLRTLCGPDAILHPNGSNRFYDALNGFMQETFPTTSTSLQLWNYVVNEWYQTSAPGDWQVSLTKSAANALRPNINSIATKTINLGSGSNYQLMRFGLCTILMTDGFFVPVAGWNWGETNLLWFDEFGGSGGSAGYECTSPLPRGYLGQPTGDRYMIGTSNVWRRDYEGGIALVNPDSVARTVSLGGTFRKIKGTQAPTVNDGSLVTEVTLQPRDGIVLLRADQAPTPPLPIDQVPPTAPSSLSTTAVSPTSVNLAWNASSDASGIREYRVYMNGSLKTTVTGTSTTVTGLSAGTAYNFCVVAVDGAGNSSAQSATLNITTPAKVGSDTIAPTISVRGVAALKAYAPPVTVVFSAWDEDSGLEAGYPIATLDEVPIASGSQVTNEGPHTLSVTARDRAGNVATTEVSFTIAATESLVIASIRGADRIATAIEASRKAFPNGTETVVVATGYNWPDALGGSALAGAFDAPILLTRPDVLPGEVRAEIVRLGSTKAIVLGGTPAVSDAVSSALDVIPGVSVERIAGENRYETAAKVAARTISRMRTTTGYGGTALVATGADFPDALAGSALAAANGWPIYLANPGQGDNASLVETMKGAGVTECVVLGGANVVASSVESRLTTLGIVTRLAGTDRYDTANRIAIYGVTKGNLQWDCPAVASGLDFPDALAGGPLQGATTSVLLLTPPSALDNRVAALLSHNASTVSEIRLIGATANLDRRLFLTK